MLVLSRKPNEEILIGENIKITVLKVKGNTVRIGIEAPQSVKVMRGELPAQKTTRSEIELQANESGNVELTLSFSPDQEGVSAASGKERTTGQPKVLRFEQPARHGRKQQGRGIAAPSQSTIPNHSNSEGLASSGTNRIKDILTRLASGLNSEDLTND